MNYSPGHHLVYLDFDLRRCSPRYHKLLTLQPLPACGRLLLLQPSQLRFVFPGLTLVQDPMAKQREEGLLQLLQLTDLFFSMLTPFTSTIWAWLAPFCFSSPSFHSPNIAISRTADGEAQSPPGVMRRRDWGLQISRWCETSSPLHLLDGILHPFKQADNHFCLVVLALSFYFGRLGRSVLRVGCRQRWRVWVMAGHTREVGGIGRSWGHCDMTMPVPAREGVCPWFLASVGRDSRDTPPVDGLVDDGIQSTASGVGFNSIW